MQYRLNGNILTINPEGKIDTNNADEISAEFLELAQKFPNEKFVLNLEKLTYISSAGLRAILKLSKIKKKNLQLIEASPNVYEVFETSGFTQIINIKKALRKISADNLIFLGKGSSGNVYKLDDENILKVYKDNWNFESVENERANSQAAFLEGIDTAIAYDVVKVGKNFGIVYEMINADTMEKVVLNDIEHVEDYARRLCKFVKKQHTIETNFEDIRTRIISIAEKVPYYSAEEFKTVREYLEALPNCKNFCHGDINLSNILLQNGQMILIDMGGIATGHPIFDISWIYFIYDVRKPLPNRVDNGPQFMPPIFWKTFAKEYFNTTDEKIIEHYERALLPLGCIRVLNAAITRPIPKESCEHFKELLFNEFERGIILPDF
jgi:uncharacterized protein (TIGR02172 family)